jgi:hypothetical protein
VRNRTKVCCAVVLRDSDGLVAYHLKRDGSTVRFFFFWALALGTCFGGLVFAIQAEKRGDTLSLALVMLICFVVIVVCISAAH